MSLTNLKNLRRDSTIPSDRDDDEMEGHLYVISSFTTKLSR